MKHENDGSLPQGTCSQANKLASTMEHVLNVLIGLMEDGMGARGGGMNSCLNRALKYKV